MFRPIHLVALVICCSFVAIVSLSGQEITHPNSPKTPSTRDGFIRQFGKGDDESRTAKRGEEEDPPTRTAMALHPNGKHLIISEKNGRLGVWDIATGERIQNLQDSGDAINCLTVSPDGHWLACGRSKRDIQLWDLRTGKIDRLIHPLGKSDGQDDRLVQRISFSPDSKTVFVSVDNQGVIALELSSGKRLWQVTQVGYNFATDPRGRWLGAGILIGEPARLAILEIATGKSLREMPIEPSWATVDGVAQVMDASWTLDRTFTPDGLRLVTSHDDGTTRVWDVATGREVSRVKWERANSIIPGGLACSPDCKWVAVREGTRILVCELLTGIHLHAVAGNDFAPRDFVFTPDGKAIVSNSRPAPTLWSIVPKDLPDLSGPKDAIWATLASMDGDKVYKLHWALARQPKLAIELFSARVPATLDVMPRARFDKLVTKLDSPEFAHRETAEKELAEAGIKAPVAWLRESLNSSSSEEVRARLNRLIARRDKPDPDEVRWSRAVHVLVMTGTDEAKSLLKTWTTSNAPVLSADAKAALERMR